MLHIISPIENMLIALIIILIFILVLAIMTCNNSNSQYRLPLVTSIDPCYNTLRFNFNKRFNVFPIAIAMCCNETDVIVAYKCARKCKLPFSIRCGKHCYESFSLSIGYIIDQSRRVRIIVNNDLITVEPGVTLGQLYETVAQHNLMCVGGTCPTVGTGGLTLGGGLGFLVREFGLTCDNVVEMRIMLADASIITVNQYNNADLFWALCGCGNGNFGIVTSITYKGHRMPPRVTIFEMHYTDKSIIDIWQHWIHEQPSTVSSELDIGTDITIKGMALANVNLTPLQTTNMLVKQVSYIEAMRFFADKQPPPFMKAKSRFIMQYFTRSQIDILSSTSVPIGIVALGGNVPKFDSSFPYRNAFFWTQYVIHWSNPEDEKASIEKITKEYNAINLPDYAYMNCPDLGIVDYKKAYYAQNYDRLLAVKKKYDSGNIFTYPQGIINGGSI